MERPGEMLGLMKEEKSTYLVGLKREQNEEGFNDKGGIHHNSFSQQIFLA